MTSSVQKKSAIWLHFTSVNEEKVKCNICSTIYSHKSGTTSNLRKHMKTKNPLVIVEDLNFQKDVTEKRKRVKIMKESEIDPQPVPSTSREEEPGTPLQLGKKPRLQTTRITNYLSQPISIARQSKINDLVLNITIDLLYP
ncbi:unnamed protein product [Diabrotica balteata]|uniref:BED-type domain-containing protein n=1 Tax=Diabrotica balteata TaxID=107213 RepID=A0A9N9SNV7_DIABA|nr:unnamed protein product [Diabrotica balteata]